MGGTLRPQPLFIIYAVYNVLKERKREGGLKLVMTPLRRLTLYTYILEGVVFFFPLLFSFFMSSTTFFVELVDIDGRWASFSVVDNNEEVGQNV